MLIPELTLAGFLLAGIVASPHCALMCGPLQALQLRRPGMGPRTALLWLQAGRITGYALLGAAAATGGLLLRQLPEAALRLPLQALSALVLLVLGLQQLRRPATPGCCPPAAARAPARRSLHPFLGGLLWALLPCAALYAMLLLAMLSGSPLYAALLMAGFGLGTTPLLGAGGLLLQRAGRARGPLRLAAAGLLIAAAGATGFVALAAPVTVAGWCYTGNR